ncbi:aminodeoxychorismate lyase [Lacticaseibacillus thailandensis DSM 22698 = JCM 13996]|uniref:Endolytic murein transglycosylase n=2 Tax=Lacticaseibacillus thailandensis TaxID=381741 RepID=A0A0R2C910_9LACO|nr:aminodeoxychorismate lyase [Lacticaseibacillus thailandensis DSM 22698 = JCM 13996]
MAGSQQEHQKIPGTSLDKRAFRDAQNRMVHRIVWWVIGIVVALVAVVGFMGYRYVTTSLAAVDPHATKDVSVRIPSGASTKQIGDVLAKRGVIKSATVFALYAKINSYSDFQAGTFQVAKSMDLKHVVNTLMGNGSTAGTQVLVREGVTVETIASSMDKYTKKNGNISKRSFMKLMRDQQFFKQLAKKYPQLLGSAAKAHGVRYRLEGYLFPATYTVSSGETMKQLVTQMVAKTNTVLKPYYATIKQKNLTVQHVLTLASIVEREGVTEKSRRKIAGVFFNRMDAGMPLQSDITVMYALNTHKTHLTNKDTAVKSPYNLYKHTGFGPGPFNQPSLQSIQAVLNPSDRSAGYLYFVANLKTGKILYARTLAEQNANIKAIGSDNQ